MVRLPARQTISPAAVVMAAPTGTSPRIGRRDRLFERDFHGMGKIHGHGSSATSGARSAAPTDGPVTAQGQGACYIRSLRMAAEAIAESTPGERIAKVIARAGEARAATAERLIAEGRVSVNGKLLASPATRIVDGDESNASTEPPCRRAGMTRLWRYHKPPGLMVSHRDPKGRPTVFQGLPGDLPRVVSVGRLDFNTEGLLLLTNDGELERQLELPATGWVRRYRVRVLGRVEPVGTRRTQERRDDRWHALRRHRRLDRTPEGSAPVAALRAPRGQEPRNQAGVRASGAHGAAGSSASASVPFQLGELEPGEIEEVPARVLARAARRMARPGRRREAVRVVGGRFGGRTLGSAARTRAQADVRAGARGDVQHSRTRHRCVAHRRHPRARSLRRNGSLRAWRPCRAARASACSSMTARRRAGLIRRNADALGLIGQCKIWRRDAATARSLRAAAAVRPDLRRSALRQGARNARTCGRSSAGGWMADPEPSSCSRRATAPRSPFPKACIASMSATTATRRSCSCERHEAGAHLRPNRRSMSLSFSSTWVGRP